MPRIEIKSIKAGNYAYYYNTLNYVAKNDRCIQGYISAANLLLPQKRSELVPCISQQVSNARMHYGQEDKRLGIHCVVNFSSEELEYLTAIQILEIGHYLSMTEFPDCMTYFAVHDHSDKLHLDMLIFPLNIHNGRMYGCQKKGWNAIEIRLQKYLLNYMPAEVVGKFQVAY